jgi:serine/threonine protein kinase
VEIVDQEVAIASSSTKWTREPGTEPIPGYRLIEPLGKGGFGEVWKCEAPGGLFKAVKFVPRQDEESGPANQEQQALQLVKAIRHPFILSLERVEVVEGVLVIVTELADKSLHALLGDYQAQQLPGIPRDELLGYLLEAAEALDWMNFRHGLQHLDIKPHNLFLVSNHVKVADFGLVDRTTDVEKTPANPRQGGVTPLYASPELLRGRVSRQCDQYSLAIVYQQLLTGMVPFWCQNLYELLVLHMTAEPNLTSLPAADRPIVARALSKRSSDRYPSCLDFIQALVCGHSTGKPTPPRRSALMKRVTSEFPPAAPNPADPRQPSSGSCPTVNSRSLPVVKTPNSDGSASPAQGDAGGESPVRESHDFQFAVTPSATPAPTCVSLPGYRFLHCVGRTPLGDIWKVVDEQGRLRRALCLPTFVDQDPVLIERLQSLSHPALPATEASWSPSGRMVLVTEDFDLTLRDRLEMCQKQGLPGIPREELLGYLRAAAEAIDALYAQHRLPHLGLNPRTLMLQDDKLRMLDYGLVPLIWLPTGQTGGSLNGRYAAPELFERPDLTGIPPGEASRAALLGRAVSAADQFSLALIYAELLNGLAPNLPRMPARRSGSGATRSGRHSDSMQVPAFGHLRLDFDLLPSCDRAVLLKALHDDPQQRFPTCTALVDSLEKAAASRIRSFSLYESLPKVIPFASLNGEPPSKDLILPPVNQIVINLAMPNLLSTTQLRTLRGGPNGRCALLPNDVWEIKCPVQIFSGALALKVEGFRSEWNARIAEQNNNHFLFHIDLPPARADELDKNPMPVVALQLDVQTTSSPRHVTEARMRVYPAGGNRFHIARVLPELAPRLFDSMRSYLQSSPDQRSEDRWPCPQPLHVYPVKPNLELDQVLEGISRNISLGGVSFRILEKPQTDRVYLHWHRSPAVSAYAVLARIIRVQPMAGGGFEVGGVF